MVASTTVRDIQALKQETTMDKCAAPETITSSAALQPSDQVLIAKIQICGAYLWSGENSWLQAREQDRVKD